VVDVNAQLSSSLNFIQARRACFPGSRSSM
jgi:hypothetical protein